MDATGAEARASRGGRFLDVATRLDYLRDLGVTAIQLLPIQEFETEFSEGYNGVDYFSPEQRYQVGERRGSRLVSSGRSTRRSPSSAPGR